MARYTVLLHRDPDDGFYLVTIPALGTATHGETVELALAMAREAIEANVAALVQLGQDVPVELEPVLVTALEVDLERIRLEVQAEPPESRHRP